MSKGRFCSVSLVLGIILALLLMSIQPASAKGQFSKITIQTADSAQPIEVSDPAFLSFWTFSDFANGTAEAPHVVGPAYEVTRYFVAADGITFEAWDRLRYYHTSSDNTDGRGWIFYEGLVNGGSEYDGKWFVATRNADALMESIIFAEPNAPTPTVTLSAVGTLTLIVFGVVWFVLYLR